MGTTGDQDFLSAGGRTIGCSAVLGGTGNVHPSLPPPAPIFARRVLCLVGNLGVLALLAAIGVLLAWRG